MEFIFQIIRQRPHPFCELFKIHLVSQIKRIIMDKRTFIKTGLVLGAGSLLAGKSITTFGSLQGDDGFKQDPLGYEYNALEPYIDAMTMELHYSKHHAGYTSKFNAAIKEAGLEGKSIKEIFASVGKYSSAIRNNGGGYYNHKLFWKVMSPKGGGDPSGSLAKAVTRNFGGVEKFREAFSKAAATVFGSGWAWLINQNGKLKIIQTPNQDNPLMDISPEKGYPLMALDVWEHAYYLKYQNKRTSYIDAFWNIVDWKYVGERFEKSMT